MYNLDCSDNKIEELPGELPSRLDNFYCNNNNIKEMPFSFVKLECLKINPFLKEKMCKIDDNNLNRKLNPDITNNPIWDKIRDEYVNKYPNNSHQDEIIFAHYSKELRKNVT